MAIEALRPGTRGHRKTQGDRTQYQDYLDYYYREISIRTPRPLQPVHRPTAQPTPRPFSIKCYSCYYEWKLNDWKGKKGCAEPFSHIDIPIVNCSGPCGVFTLVIYLFSFVRLVTNVSYMQMTL